MRRRLGRWLIVGVAVLGAAACACAAAPPTSERPAKPWTGTIAAHKGIIWEVALSRDGQTLVTAADDKKVAVWDLRTGKLVRERVWGERASLHRPAFVSGEKEIVCESHGEILILDRRSLKTRLSIERGRNSISALAASPCGRYLATAVGGVVSFREVATGEVLWEHTHRGDKVYALAFSPDGKVLAAAVHDDPHTVRLHDPRTGREVGKLANANDRFHGVIYGLAFSPDGRLVAAGGRGAFLHVWDAKSRELVRLLEWKPVGKEEGMLSLAFSPDGKTIAAVCCDPPLRLFEVATGGLRHAIEPGGIGGAFCPDGRLVLANPSKGEVKVCSWRELGAPKPGRLAADDLTRLWADLGSMDAGAAHKAAAALLGSPEQAETLLARLRRAEPLTDEQVARLIADLDGDDLDVREKATEDLKHAAARAEKALRAALAKPPSVEVKKRAAAILKNLTPLRPERLRSLRAVEVLEAIGSPEAQKQLERLAAGARGDELTDDASAALARVRKVQK